jgi:hypothetical protein
MQSEMTKQNGHGAVLDLSQQMTAFGITGTMVRRLIWVELCD